jgi:hypothetical protein
MNLYKDSASRRKATGRFHWLRLLSLAAAILLPVCLLPISAVHAAQATLSNAQIDNLVARSYQYVAMYNVNNKFAIFQGGWNTCLADTRLKDHTMQDIARPNNDTLYLGCMLDLRHDAAILEMPAFDSKYVSLMITGYDHYVNIPISTRQGHFQKPEKILIYTARTEGYAGEAVEGIDHRFEATGDFVSAVFRVMPHASDAERFERITDQMKSLRLTTLAEYRGGKARPVGDVAMPAVGRTNADVFGSNLLQVMQFVFNHTTFHADDPLDQALLAAWEPLGIAPGRKFDAARAPMIDLNRFRAAAEDITAAELAAAGTPEKVGYIGSMFMPKGQMSPEVMLFQSVAGPIGMPAEEALYPPITTVNGEQMNARHDYVIRMAAQDLPPAKAFWSITLYDTKNGFFIPNDRKKYSVGENAGMKLDADGGIAIHIAAQQPQGVPEENWLPINRKDETIDAVMRIYVPDLEKMKTWQAPKAEVIVD